MLNENGLITVANTDIKRACPFQLTDFGSLVLIQISCKPHLNLVVCFQRVTSPRQTAVCTKKRNKDRMLGAGQRGEGKDVAGDVVKEQGRPLSQQFCFVHNFVSKTMYLKSMNLATFC